MIKQKFDISKYRWQVIVLYEVTTKDIDYVIDVLDEICDDDYAIAEAVNNIELNHLNTGFIYSNYNTRKSLIVISNVSSTGELLDTVVHEANHLRSHIGVVYNIDETSEEASYLIGYIVKTMYETFRKII